MTTGSKKIKKIFLGLVFLYTTSVLTQSLKSYKTNDNEDPLQRNEYYIFQNGSGNFEINLKVLREQYETVNCQQTIWDLNTTGKLYISQGECTDTGTFHGNWNSGIKICVVYNGLPRGFPVLKIPVSWELKPLGTKPKSCFQILENWTVNYQQTIWDLISNGKLYISQGECTDTGTFDGYWNSGIKIYVVYNGFLRGFPVLKLPVSWELKPLGTKSKSCFQILENWTVNCQQTIWDLNTTGKLYISQGECTDTGTFDGYWNSGIKIYVVYNGFLRGFPVLKLPVSWELKPLGTKSKSCFQILENWTVNCQQTIWDLNTTGKLYISQGECTDTGTFDGYWNSGIKICVVYNGSLRGSPVLKIPVSWELKPLGTKPKPCFQILENWKIILICRESHWKHFSTGIQSQTEAYIVLWSGRENNHPYPVIPKDIIRELEIVKGESDHNSGKCTVSLYERQIDSFQLKGFTPIARLVGFTHHYLHFQWEDGRRRGTEIEVFCGFPLPIYYREAAPDPSERWLCTTICELRLSPHDLWKKAMEALQYRPQKPYCIVDNSCQTYTKTVLKSFNYDIKISADWYPQWWLTTVTICHRGIRKYSKENK
ncbi:hypothetical protein SK128_011942 [Halocaridina rubra]|uniref:Uncharacterized protein n=1 Tax=Halocaridina rubra TaxID=373956 RepID=A0AAN9AGF6_HALRR